MLAYIDPGTGAIVLQVVVAAVLTAGVVLRRVIFSPFALLLRLRPSASVAADGSSSEAEPVVDDEHDH